MDDAAIHEPRRLYAYIENLVHSEGGLGPADWGRPRPCWPGSRPISLAKAGQLDRAPPGGSRRSRVTAARPKAQHLLEPRRHLAKNERANLDDDELAYWQRIGKACPGLDDVLAGFLNIAVNTVSQANGASGDRPTQHGSSCTSSKWCVDSVSHTLDTRKIATNSLVREGQIEACVDTVLAEFRMRRILRDQVLIAS